MLRGLGFLIQAVYDSVCQSRRIGFGLAPPTRVADRVQEGAELRATFDLC